MNELWHIDLKGPFYLVGATGRARTCHFVALVDDHSRFLLGIRAVPTKEAIWVLALLEEAIELRGVPHELMTDDGTPFVAIVRTMLGRFQRSLAELRIRHIRTQIDTPWTNGKVEAFWATLQSEVLDRQHLADLAAARPRSPPMPVTTTTTASMANSTGRPPPNASMAPRSPTAVSRACPSWLPSRPCWTPSLPPEESHLHRGTSLSRALSFDLPTGRSRRSDRTEAVAQDQRPAGQLDTYHYDADPEEVARIDELEQASQDWADRHPHPAVDPWSPDDPVKPWERPGWVGPLADD